MRLLPLYIYIYIYHPQNILLLILLLKFHLSCNLLVIHAESVTNRIIYRSYLLVRYIDATNSHAWKDNAKNCISRQFSMYVAIFFFIRK